MTIKELDAINHIGNNVYSCMLVVDGTPKEYINEAKKADGDAYLDSCMVVHAYYDMKNDIMTYNLLYITENGNDLEWPCELYKEDEKNMLDMIRKDICYED